MVLSVDAIVVLDVNPISAVEYQVRKTERDIVSTRQELWDADG